LNQAHIELGRPMQLGNDVMHDSPIPSSAGNSPLVRLETASRYYVGGRVRAVDRVDLEILTGEWLTITGASGSGKSTLLSLISGLDTPSEGRVLLHGKTVKSAKAWARVRARFMGLVFQSFNLIPTLTAIENVQIPMFGNGANRTERVRRARGLLDRVGLAKANDRRPAELSGGELQRVAIARALANNPHMLLADEPTGNLDTANAQQILELLKELHLENTFTVVMVTHDPLVAQWGDHRICMKDGQVDRQVRCRLDEPCTF
jgi:putative ABC transport system ATP-binding protein